MEAFSNNEFQVLVDMVEDWSDKNRHGELESGWSYDENSIESFHSLARKVNDEAKRRGFWWAQ